MWKCFGYVYVFFLIFVGFKIKLCNFDIDCYDYWVVEKNFFGFLVFFLDFLWIRGILLFNIIIVMNFLIMMSLVILFGNFIEFVIDFFYYVGLVVF